MSGLSFSSTHPIRILVWPGGNEIGLEVRRSLMHRGDIQLLSAASEGPNHGPFTYAEHHILPPIGAPSWQDAVMQLVEEQQIDLIYPAHPLVIDGLLEWGGDNWPVPVVLAPAPLVELTRSKIKTYARLEGRVPLARQYKAGEPVAFPVFIKPARGHGSLGARVLETREALEAALMGAAEAVIQDYLPGEEYTVDCLSDSSGTLLFAGARRRDRVWTGIAMTTVDADPVTQEACARLAEAIAEVIPLTGAWFFQVKESRDGVLTLLEVEARLGGTAVHHRMRGVNFAEASVLVACGLPVNVEDDGIAVTLDRALTARVSRAADYDRLVVHGAVLSGSFNTLDPRLVALLVQGVQKGKPVQLVAADCVDGDALDRLSGLFETHATAATVGPGVLYIDRDQARRHEARAKGALAVALHQIEAYLDDRI